MDAKKRQQLLLTILGIVLVAAVYVVWPRSTPGRAAPASPRRGPAAKAAAGSPSGSADVRIEALKDEKPAPGDGERNLFKFKPRYAPPPPTPPRPVNAPIAPPAPVGPPPPPPVAPIPLKFIGIVEAPGAPRMAVLSDGRGTPVYGKEGESVLGQYRITRIGAESIEMEYVDGRGRQTIRLSGS